MPKVAALTPITEYRKCVVPTPTRKSSTPQQSSNKSSKPIPSGSKVDKARSAGTKFAPKDAIALLKDDHKQVAEWFADGLVNIVGGCCGTTPDHIAAIARASSGAAPRAIPSAPTLTMLAGLEPMILEA